MTGPPRRPERVLARRGGRVELLRIPAALYGAICAVRTRLYDRGWLATRRLEVPVVSVGNLTAGGTGKTPMIVWLARRLAARGRRPGVLSRGYRAPRGSAERENDEARMLARYLPDVPRVQNPDRLAGGRRLVELGAEVVLLDDGFQHRRLARDLDLVLVDATRPWGLPALGAAPVRALLPRGLLREPPGELRRADAIVMTRSDQVSAREREELSAELHRLAPRAPILFAVLRPIRVVDPRGRGAHPSSLRGREVDLLSALGNPDAFEATVRRLGASVRTHRSFPDHHPYRREDLDGLGGGSRAVVTTAKDAVKLDGLASEVHVLEVDMAFDGGEAILDALLESLPRGARERERASLHEGLHG